MKKSILVCLLVAVLSLAAMLGAAAASEASVRVGSFAFRSVFSENADVYAFEDGTVSVIFREGAPTVLMENVEETLLEEGNALRLVLENNSGCNQLTISYTYWNEDGTEEMTATEMLTIERKSGKRAYYVYPSYIDRIKELRFVFSGGYSGNVLFYAVDVVSIYNDSGVNPGTISDCVYDQSRSVVRISGTVAHEIAVNTRDATVELYAFGMDETITARKIGYATPLAAMPLSTRFEFEVPVIFFSDRFLQYTVAIMSPEGRVLHLFAPQLPCIPQNGGVQTPSFKGIYTDKTTLATRADPDTVIVDVYLDRMQSEGSTGLLHVVNGRYYYIDRAYIHELDELVKRYKSAGSQVYFRLLLTGDGGYHPLHGRNIPPMESAYRGLYIAGESARFMLFAYTEFLCRRYDNTEALTGFIVGRGIDNSAENNYVGNPSLERYTKIYATALYLISEAAHTDGRELDIVVPLTSNIFGGDSVPKEQGRYSPRILLASLCKCLSHLYGEGLTFRLMIEDETAWDGADINENEEIREFEQMKDEIADEYGRIDDGYLYYWIPRSLSSEMIPHVYTYMYYRSVFTKASAFILSTEKLTDGVAWEALLETVKYIDTNKGIGRSSESLKALGADQWASLIPSFNLLALSRRQAYIYETYAVPPSSALGSYVMWDHQQGRSIYDWSLGTEGTLVVSDVDNMGRALVATLTPDPLQAGYSEIIYAYSADEIMNAVDMLSVDLMALGKEGETYKLILEICGDTASAEVTAYLRHGVRETVYLNTLDLGRDEHIRNIRIFSAPVEGDSPYSLCIERLAAHSTSLDDEALGEAVREARLATMEGDVDATENNAGLSTPLKIFLATLILSISVIILVSLARRSEDV